jgi:hypothetical protein
MKIALLHDRFARILLSGWILVFVGSSLLFLLGFLFPGPWIGYVVKTIWILSIFVVLGTFAYAAAYIVRRASLYCRSVWQKEGK